MSTGVPYDENLVHSQPPTLLHGKESMREYLRLDNPPTAILCVNDYLAIGAIRTIHEAGLKVPEDISVCGFDDIDISAYFTPPLTSIRTPCYELGQMSAEIAHRLHHPAKTVERPLFAGYRDHLTKDLQQIQRLIHSTPNFPRGRPLDKEVIPSDTPFQR